MAQLPEDCGYRRPIASDPGGGAICKLVSRVTGISDPEMCHVQRDACEACCQTLRGREQINPVIASLVYRTASQIVDAGGHVECSVERARKLMQCAIDQVLVVLDKLPDRSFPPESGQLHDAVSRPAGRPRSLTWAVGLLTAPRREPTIERAIRSLKGGGFDRIHIFAEPDSWLPADCHDLPVVVHPRRLGNFVNFYSSLTRLLGENRSANVLAMFQDDVEAAAGLKPWCDEQLWPLDAGLVSLFTPRLHSGRATGWRLLSPGYQRVCGAQALVFRRETLERFLSDPHVVRSLQTGRDNDDAVVAGWVAREGMRIAYHTPSLVQHIGEVSSIAPEQRDHRVVAHAVGSVDQINTWDLTDQRHASIGLVGWNTPTGLGYQNRDIATHLAVDRWLIPSHPSLASLHLPTVDADIGTISSQLGDPQLAGWLRGLDWVLFVERPYFDNLAQVAAQSGIGVACVPNWELLRPELSWLAFVDVMFCPTQHTFRQLTDWKHRYGFGWDVVHIPWPIDTQRFQFRQRNICRRFLYVHGWGGGRPVRLDRSRAGYARKGFELILSAARLAPHLSFVVYSLTDGIAGLPDNIELRRPPADNLPLYADCDVCVQPSHYEGLGLQLLECQAAGMPLVTTDAAPMNEYMPYRTIPVCGTEVVCVEGSPISSQLMNAHDLVDTLEALIDTDIRKASQQAREFVVRRHSWDTAIGTVLGSIQKR